MKKLVAATTALALACALGTTAFADTVETPGDTKVNVTAKYSDAVSTPDVYSLDLTWDDMTFTYSESGTRTWDPQTHTYTESTTAGWDKTSANITMTNHSNVAVKVNFAYEPIGDTGVTGTIPVNDFQLKAGPEGNPAGASTKFATLNISGTPNGTVTADGIRVGNITITVSKDA